MTTLSPLISTPRLFTCTAACFPQQADGQPALTAIKLEGEEGINRLFEYRLLLQTPDALAGGLAGQGGNFALDGWIGEELTCRLLLEGQGAHIPGLAGLAGMAGLPNRGAGVREISGLISEAAFLGEDNRHALYQVTLRPWPHLAELTSDCKVFQDQTPVEVIGAVLKDYAYLTEQRLSGQYPKRDYCVQYNESDWAFITRLMQEWGINYHFEHRDGHHVLVLSDHNGAFAPFQAEQPDSAYHQIPYHPPGHKIDREYIHAFIPQRRLVSGKVSLRDYDYSRPKADLAVSAEDPRPTAHAEQERYLWRHEQGGDYSQPQAGIDQENHTEGQGRQLASLRVQALRQHGNRAQGEGYVRGIVPGHSFQLTGHPQAAANAEYLVLHTHLLVENAGEDTQRNTGGNAAGNSAATPATALKALSDEAARSGQWRIDCRFEVQPATEAMRPEITQPKPQTGGPECAVVTGPEDGVAANNHYTDALGRIKVQFPWDRYGRKNQTSSCWLRVALPWAGNQLGALFVPRVGEEVLVEFIGGDPDLPVCVGMLHNPQNQPPWRLPNQQALSGIRSRELTPGGGNAAAGRSNHLILDDTAERIQAQIKSDHGHSQLNLGHITRIEDNQGRKDYRGAGFELRTDQHGAVRAKDGLLLSTEGRANAQAHLLDIGETTQRLSQGHSQHESLGELASQHQAQDGNDQAKVAAQLKAQNAEIQGKGAAITQGQGGAIGQTQTGGESFPELAVPHLVLASPAGITSTAAGSTHQHSGEHHAVTAGGHVSVSAGKSLLASVAHAVRFFAYKAGIKLIAAKEEVNIQALQENIKLAAQTEITHTAQRIKLQAQQRAVVNGGGSYSEWQASGVETATPAMLTSYTGGKTIAGPKSLPVAMNMWQGGKFDQELLVEHADGKGAPKLKYEVVREAGAVAGTTGSSGSTTVQKSDTPELARVRIKGKHHV